MARIHWSKQSPSFTTKQPQRRCNPVAACSPPVPPQCRTAMMIILCAPRNPVQHATLQPIKAPIRFCCKCRCCHNGSWQNQVLNTSACRLRQRLAVTHLGKPQVRNSNIRQGHNSRPSNRQENHLKRKTLLYSCKAIGHQCKFQVPNTASSVTQNSHNARRYIEKKLTYSSSTAVTATPQECT